MSRVVAVIVDVDGENVRAHFDSEPSEETLAAFRDVVRAARRMAADLPPLCRVRGRTDGGVVPLPCLLAPGHEPPHRDRTGRPLTSVDNPGDTAVGTL